jgi:hypothetical protein
MGHMKTKIYTLKQIQEFLDFVKRTQLRFNDVSQVENAIASFTKNR